MATQLSASRMHLVVRDRPGARTRSVRHARCSRDSHKHLARDLVGSHHTVGLADLIEAQDVSCPGIVTPASALAISVVNGITLSGESWVPDMKLAKKLRCTRDGRSLMRSTLSTASWPPTKHIWAHAAVLMGTLQRVSEYWFRRDP